MTHFEHITATSGVLSGKPRIIGTRISVDFILELVASGGSIDDIVAAYPHLSKEAVSQAITFAAHRIRNETDMEISLAA